MVTKTKALNPRAPIQSGPKHFRGPSRGDTFFKSSRGGRPSDWPGAMSAGAGGSSEPIIMKGYLLQKDNRMGVRGIRPWLKRCNNPINPNLITLKTLPNSPNNPNACHGRVLFGRGPTEPLVTLSTINNPTIYICRFCPDDQVSRLVQEGDGLRQGNQPIKYPLR